MSESNPLALDTAATATEAPASEPTGPQLGTDLFDEGKPLAPADDQAPALPKADQQAVDPSKIDLARAKVEDLPPELQPAARFVKQMQADYTRKTQDIADMRRQIEEERRQYLDAVQRLQQPQAATPATDPLEQLAARLERPEDRQGLQVVDQLFQQRIEAKLQPILQYLQQLNQTLPQIQQQVGTMTAAQQAVVREQVGAELAAAHEAYGEDVVREYGQQVLALYGQVNPRTGKGFTVAELVGLLSGQAAKEVAEASAATTQAQRKSKAQAAGPRTAQTAERGSGAISKEEALQQIGALFGR